MALKVYHHSDTRRNSSNKSSNKTLSYVEDLAEENQENIFHLSLGALPHEADFREKVQYKMQFKL